MTPPTATFRAETAAVVRLALPITLVQVGTLTMGTVDVMMLGRVSEVGLASVGIGSAVAFGLVIFFIGLLGALDPLVAQAYGAGDDERVGRYLKQGIATAVAASLPISLLMWDARPALRLLGQQPEIVEGAAEYLRAQIPGVPALLIYTALQRTLQSMSIVRPAFVAIVVANVVNFLTDYALVFGNWGFPALGSTGAGWATSVSRWVMVLCLVAGAFEPLRRYGSIRIEGRSRRRGYATFLRLGAPIGVHISLEYWLFGCVSLMMGNLGALEAAGHQVAINLASLVYMVALGISEAAATRVGNAIGRRDMDAARRGAVVCLILGAAILALLAAVLFLFARFLSRMYTPDADVIALAANLVRIAAFFALFDSLQAISGGVLRGAADTKVPATLALIGYWFLGLPLGVALGYGAGLGPRGLWWGLTLGLASVAVLMLTRVVRRFRTEIAAVE